MRSRRVNARATRSALIAASVPELTKRTRSIEGTSVRTALAELVLERARRTEARSEPCGFGDRLDQPARCVPVDQRSPRHHVVDEAVPIDVFEDGAGAAPDEERRSAHRRERADRTVDATGQNRGGAGVEGTAACRFLHGGIVASLCESSEDAAIRE
jgi:hypothetical protein